MEATNGNDIVSQSWLGRCTSAQAVLSDLVKIPEIQCRLQVSDDAMLERDQLVFSRCREAGVPVCMLLSGGYARHSASAVASSLANLLSSEAV